MKGSFGSAKGQNGESYAGKIEKGSPTKTGKKTSPYFGTVI